MAADSHGNLYVSITYYSEDTNTGQLWRVSPDGHKKLLASMDLTGYGALTGVAIDSCDRVHVALWDFSLLAGLPEEMIGSGSTASTARRSPRSSPFRPRAGRTALPSIPVVSTSPTVGSGRSGGYASVRA